MHRYSGRTVVFNDDMTRSFKAAIAAITLGAALVPASASASIVELGQTTSPVVAPACPAGVSKVNCTIILTETTALETLADGVAYPTTVKTSGRIVAFTVGLAKLTKADVSGLDSAYGGTSRIAITVLKPGKNKLQRQWTVRDQSPLFHVQPWFGHVVQFPLTTSLDAQKGDTIALAVSTWAPILSISLPAKQFQYRASRATQCTTYNIQTAQLTIGANTQYKCFYVSTRVQYTATEVTTPGAPKDQVKGRRRIVVKGRRVVASKRIPRATAATLAPMTGGVAP